MLYVARTLAIAACMVAAWIAVWFFAIDPVLPHRADGAGTIHAEVISAEPEGDGARVSIRIINGTDAFITTAAFHASAYDADDGCLARAWIIATDLRPGGSCVENAYLIDVVPARVVRWDLQLHCVAVAH